MLPPYCDIGSALLCGKSMIDFFFIDSNLLCCGWKCPFEKNLLNRDIDSKFKINRLSEMSLSKSDLYLLKSFVYYLFSERKTPLKIRFNSFF